MLQSARVPEHEPMAHDPELHTGLENGAEQRLLHAPQLFTSVLKLKPSSICPSQLLSMRSQASTPLLVRTHAYSQPSENSALQSEKPLAHACTPQVPCVQRYAETFDALHTRLHAPQWFGSVLKLKPSSTTPLQSLSRLSQTSGPLGVHAYSQPSAS